MIHDNNSRNNTNYTFDLVLLTLSIDRPFLKPSLCQSHHRNSH